MHTFLHGIAGILEVYNFLLEVINYLPHLFLIVFLEFAHCQFGFGFYILESSLPLVLPAYQLLDVNTA